MKRITKKFLAMIMVLSLLLNIGSVSFASSRATLAGSAKHLALAAEDQNSVAKTQFGSVKGLANGNNLTWYGIPYGAEPVGALRWSKPQDPKNWTDTLDCTAKEPVALQYAAASKSVVGSTNCLNLDVYATTSGKKDLPVYVFYHGGNNQTGSSFGDLTGASVAIDDNCIVVDVNYRLGLLGFNCLPALMTDAGASGNFTLYDMQKSLQWIKNNISAFGGDPNNVTISGHSAGGRDVMAMLISPLFKDLFQKAIVSSGGMTTSDVRNSASKIAAFLAPLVVKHGKFSSLSLAKAWLLTTGSDVKDFLYSLSSEEIMAAVGDAAIRMSAFPHLYADGITIPKEGFNTKNYNDVPVIMISGSDEFSFFNSGKAYTDGSISSSELKAAQAFGNKYGSLMYGYFNTNASAQTMKANGYQAPIYLMNCNFGHDPSVWSDMPMGSCHGIVLGFMDRNSGMRAYFASAFKTDGAAKLTTLTSGYIKDFLASSTGNPNSSDRTNWSVYTPSNTKWLVMDATRDSASAEMKDIAVTNYMNVLLAMDHDKTISSKAKTAVIKTVLNGRWFSAALDKRYLNITLWK